jgi:ABC-type nickel/cobalt efflux system permease component RcnA
MKRVALLVCLLAALAPASAAAHPLGNFTVNRYSRVDLSGNRVYVLYALDMAEIPAFQERRRIGNPTTYARALTHRIGHGLELVVGGQRAALRPLGHELAFPPGVGGLKTLRFQAVYASAALEGGSATSLRYRDRNFEGRIGWKEVVVQARDGARLVSSSAPAKSISAELLAYPKDLLSSPPEVTSARATIVTGESAGPPPPLLSRSELEARASVRETGDRGFATLIRERDLTLGFVLLSLLVALFWGAAHALSPGHGKALVAAYLVGSRGSPRHALLLGGIVTITHTSGVFALGLVTLALSEFVVPEDLYPWLNLVSALMVVAVGVAVLRWRLSDWLHARSHARGRAHDHGHGHGRGHHHRHQGHGHHHHGQHDHEHTPSAPGLRGLVAVGVSGGVIPCPTALVVLLAAISLHRIGYGLVLIVAFSLGLAATITAIGLVAVTAKRAFARLSFEGRLVRVLPAVSALAVLGLGIAMTVRALPDIS